VAGHAKSIRRHGPASESEDLRRRCMVTVVDPPRQWTVAIGGRDGVGFGTALAIIIAPLDRPVGVAPQIRSRQKHEDRAAQRRSATTRQGFVMINVWATWCLPLRWRCSSMERP